MDRVSLFKMSKQRCHSSIQNTERYAYLGLGHLYDAVVSIKFSAHDKFGAESGQWKWPKSSRKWWARLDL